MRKHKLHLDELAVESFDTTTIAVYAGTVDGHAVADGTFMSMCDSCGGFTCVQDTTCAPEHTCVHNMTCAPEHTCNLDCGDVTQPQ